AGSDALELLQARDAPLGQVALRGGGLVVGDRSTTAAGRRNDGFGALIGQQLSQAVGIVGLVGDEPLDRPRRGEKCRSKRNIVDVAGRKQKHAGPPPGVGQCMDFRRAPAARATDGFPEGPPFPPAAERCALMWELSMATVPMIPVDPVKASNISNQMPCRLQRLKRL